MASEMGLKVLVYTRIIIIKKKKMYRSLTYGLLREIGSIFVIPEPGAYCFLYVTYSDELLHVG